MTIVHHPSDATLAAFAAGQLDEGRRLVVAMHIARCPACRKAAATFEAVGGEAIAENPPIPIAPDALSRALNALDAEPREASSSRKPQLTESDILSAYGLGPWRWVGPGVYFRTVGVPRDHDKRVFMLRAAPGTSLPHHAHTGFEWTCILKGAFRHELGRYGPGDFDEADDSIEHDPFVEHGDECICIVAMQGQLKFKSLLGRLLQPLVRI